MRAAVEELLTGEGLAASNMQAAARPGTDIDGLPQATARQSRDLCVNIAWWLWETDLGIFFAALIVLGISLYSGALYSLRVPEVSLTEFRDALAHGEVLLMVDVPVRQVAAIEHCIGHYHPTGGAGGSSWTMGLFGIQGVEN